MKIATKRGTLCLFVATFATVHMVDGVSGQESNGKDSKGKTTSTENDDTSDWALQNEEHAIAKAREIIGVSERDIRNVTAKLVTLAEHEDKTPFLHDQIIGRPIWQIVITKWKLRLTSAGPDEKDLYERTFDIFVDPKNGHLLKILSRWPKGVPPIAPRPPANSAEEQLKNAGLEKYHRFPETKPTINFIEALDVVLKEGFGSPQYSRQILAHYVVRSKMRREPRPVWVIILHGIPPFDAIGGSGVPEDARNHIRNIVDAETGKWLGANTSPQPITTTTQGDERGDS